MTPCLRVQSNALSDLQFTLLKLSGLAMAQAVSRWLLTTEFRVRARVNRCGICGGQFGTGTRFSPSSSVLPSQYHFNCKEDN
jgi:hypothetical protein